MKRCSAGRADNANIARAKSPRSGVWVRRVIVGGRFIRSNGGSGPGFGQPYDQLLAVAVSPAVNPQLTTPPALGAERPAFPPAPPEADEIWSIADLRTGIKTNWRNPADGQQLPLGAHVRAPAA